MAISDTLVTDGIYQGWTPDDYDTGPDGTIKYVNTYYGSHTAEYGGNDTAVRMSYYVGTSMFANAGEVSPGPFESGVDSFRMGKTSGGTTAAYWSRIYGETNVNSNTLTAKGAFTIEGFYEFHNTATWETNGSYFDILTIRFGSKYIVHIQAEADGAGTITLRAQARGSGGDLTSSTTTITSDGKVHLAAVAYESGGSLYLEFYVNCVQVGSTVSQSGSFNDTEMNNYNTEVYIDSYPPLGSTDFVDYTIGDFGWYQSQVTSTTLCGHVALLGPKVSMSGSGAFALTDWWMADIVDGTPPKSVQIEANIFELDSSQAMPGLFVRYQSQDTFYTAYFNRNTNKWTLLLLNSGVPTVLGTSTAITPNDDEYHVCLSIVDSTLIVTVNNVTVISTTNSSISAAGKFGLLYRKSA